MTPSSEEKELHRLLQSFPVLTMDADKQREIAGQLRHEKEQLTQRKRRKAYGRVIGGIAASFAVLLITYSLVPSTLSSPEAGTQLQPQSPKASQHVSAGEAAEGKERVVTIDQQIQTYVEEALAKTEAAYHPEAVTMIVSDPNTGEILGMASRGQQVSDERNAYAGRAILDPAAALRVVTLSAAIEEGKFDPREIYESGTYTDLPGEPVKDFNAGIGWGKITFLEGFLRASDVLFAKLGVERLQNDLLQEYWQRFGFGQKTGIELDEEETGKIPVLDNLRDVALAASGQGGSASAMQQVAAVGAIANGGKLLKPHLTKRAGADMNQASQSRQVISEETAEQVRDILTDMVQSRHGVGRTFSLEKYPVAGNTGLAQKYDQQGQIIPGKYIATFIGFAPSDQPKLLVYLSVDDPIKEDSFVGLWWGEILSPPFREVMEKSLEHLGQRGADK